MNEQAATIRLDKWLWYARFFKSRSLAAKQVSGGKVRVNSERVTKNSTLVKATDVLTFAQVDTIRVIQIDKLGTRRGPAPEAQELYTDITPKPDPDAANAPEPPRVGKRPTKRNRRDIDKLRETFLDTY